ncbi:MAG: ASCH domain-containing protein [Alphaproteobacteria bacterium]
MIGTKTVEVEAFWQRARKAMGISANDYVALTFASPEFTPRVDYISGLCAQGIKRGTCHMALDFEVTGIKRRDVGTYWVVLDSKNAPLCLVRITEIEVRPFNTIGQDFASVENEGDGSFKYWHDAHHGFFNRQCKAWGKEWREDTPCVCETFELVYKE